MKTEPYTQLQEANIERLLLDCIKAYNRGYKIDQAKTATEAAIPIIIAKNRGLKKLY